jgi:MoxR-like ATPase
LRHRSFVTPDDAQDVALPVLLVRLGIDPDAAVSVVGKLLESISVPDGSEVRA